MNRKRHPDYIRLKKLINDCTKLTQLENLRQVVSETNKLFKNTKWHDDGIDLMIIFLGKENDLDSSANNLVIIDTDHYPLNNAQ